ncbi:MAG: hypothetical protein F4Y91_16395 [Gemmatimonadetes bacterium]|nr:hypothetical protein [Gemmatimonadota bacterium]MXY83587.1 hypothetical protein [Gemmatimonadota bacterium]MYB69906.1 hypothetical protein [Gemmatimonadota bacterium]
MTSKKKYLFDQPRNVHRLIWVFFVLCALLLGVELFFHRHLNFAEGVFPVEGWFGFYAIYGFVACVLLVLTATQMRKVLMRREDYYD